MAERRRKMSIWEVWGAGLEKLYIKAESFDKALKNARLIDKNYDSGRVIENIKKPC